jgi:uncharacterized protein (TIGR03067 family)
MPLLERVGTERDLERLQGTWRYVSGWREARLEVRDDWFHMEFANGTVYNGTVSLDPHARPRAMDLRIEEGPAKHAGKLCLAIYQFDGDHLIWAPGEPGSGERPEAFPAHSDPEHLCVVFVRA